jgi:spermidine/putrescine-binding protein
VRATLAALESGNVDAGIVYKTDASICKAVKVVFEVPAKEGPDISYPIAVVKGSKNPEAAMKFLDYLKSEQALTVFRKYGIAGVAQSQWEIVGFTVLVAGLATVAIFPFGVALAWLLARRSWSGKSIVKTLVALPLVMPPVTKKFDDAMNNNDAAARAALYTEDAIFGRDAIERHYADLLQKVHFSNHVLTDDQDSPHITGPLAKRCGKPHSRKLRLRPKFATGEHLLRVGD